MTERFPARDAESPRGAAGLALDPAVVAVLRARLPVVAERCVAAITAEVPGYARAWTGSMGATIGEAVQTALGAFLRLAEQARSSDPSTPLEPALQGAYELGRGEARSGRSMDALLAAYRVGARVSWRELSATAVEVGLSAPPLAQFAELVFAYIDELSAASAAGHSDELETTGRVRQRYLDQLTQELLDGNHGDALLRAAERADWAPPTTLTAVLVAPARLRDTLALLDPRTLALAVDAPGGRSTGVLLVPDLGGPGRRRLLRTLRGRAAVVGPTRPWDRVGSSYTRALRATAEGIGAALRDATAPTGEPGDAEPLDTDEHLAALVLTADPEALADLRERALAPLADLKPATAERLAETLRCWLLHHGRREDVAADLVVHPQTVRYRMTQIRELYGDRLSDPAAVLELTIALAAGPSDVAGT